MLLKMKNKISQFLVIFACLINFGFTYASSFTILDGLRIKGDTAVISIKTSDENAIYLRLNYDERNQIFLYSNFTKTPFTQSHSDEDLKRSIFLAADTSHIVSKSLVIVAADIQGVWWLYQLKARPPFRIVKRVLLPNINSIKSVQEIGRRIYVGGSTTKNEPILFSVNLGKSDEAKKIVEIKSAGSIYNIIDIVNSKLLLTVNYSNRTSELLGTDLNGKIQIKVALAGGASTAALSGSDNVFNITRVENSYYGTFRNKNLEIVWQKKIFDLQGVSSEIFNVDCDSAKCFITGINNNKIIVAEIILIDRKINMHQYPSTSNIVGYERLHSVLIGDVLYIRGSYRLENDLMNNFTTHFLAKVD